MSDSMRGCLGDEAACSRGEGKGMRAHLTGGRMSVSNSVRGCQGGKVAQRQGEGKGG
jgi:hypothetical protein